MEYDKEKGVFIKTSQDDNEKVGFNGAFSTLFRVEASAVVGEMNP